MGGKGKKKGKKSKKDAGEDAAAGGGGEEEGAENGEGNGNGKKGKKGKKGKAGKSSKFQGDIFSEAAMENAYYVCHNLMDLLKVRHHHVNFIYNFFFIDFKARGFAWTNDPKKKKKGKK